MTPIFFKITSRLFICLLLLSTKLNAQVGIGTTNPDASSILELTSTTQGLLTPRMTTLQRTAIASPANGLMVYDTDLNAFHHYDSSISAWSKVQTNSRLKFKRIKSTDVLATVLAEEKTAGGGSKYLLDSSTLYEINGLISVDLPIELNNACISGLDTSDDKLVKTSGDLFTGTTGGNIRLVTINVTGGGKAFNLLGTGIQTLNLRDAIVSGCNNVGTIENFFYVFNSIVLYTGNTTGIVYKNISKLLLSNTAWFSTNTGTFEKLEGTFETVIKQGGFSEVTGSAIGFDVSSNPIVTEAVMETVVFKGTLTTGKYVNPYTVGGYTNYNFNNNWTIRCTGIPTEGDAQATGNLYFDRTQVSPTVTPNATNAATPYSKVPGTTIATNLFRMGTGTSPVSSANNRLQYVGKKPRTFALNATISFVTSGIFNSDHVFFFVKFNSSGVATVLSSSETFVSTDSTNALNLSLAGTVQMNSGDYVELHVARIAGESSKDLTIKSFNIAMD
ncbi:hypothetical protein [Flavobacterium terrigena]|uniref:Cell wall anchor protein n=1 Tax=Flavobacterium terrigena TaxID=402734 RepID=A0A1H6QH99_9FLAO|nr:hypothetical protein [Flavobacterium terrigena]SEI38605.1 hypothetical protein SAMN05660918_0260 [Flavobacterium terrigena]